MRRPENLKADVRAAIKNLNDIDEQVIKNLEDPEFVETWKAPCFRTPYVFRQSEADMLRQAIAERNKRSESL